MTIDRDDIFRTVIGIVLSLLAFIGYGIKVDQADISCRLRAVELQNARIMERLGITDIVKNAQLPPWSGPARTRPGNQ